MLNNTIQNNLLKFFKNTAMGAEISKQFSEDFLKKKGNFLGFGGASQENMHNSMLDSYFNKQNFIDSENHIAWLCKSWENKPI